MFQISDILVRSRMWIRILGSVSLTNGSGCGCGSGSGSCYFRGNKKQFFSLSFYAYSFLKVPWHTGNSSKIKGHKNSKNLRSHKTVEIKIFINVFACWCPDGRIQETQKHTDPTEHWKKKKPLLMQGRTRTCSVAGEWAPSSATEAPSPSSRSRSGRHRPSPPPLTASYNSKNQGLVDRFQKGNHVRQRSEEKTVSLTVELPLPYRDWSKIIFSSGRHWRRKKRMKGTVSRDGFGFWLMICMVNSRPKKRTRPVFKFFRWFNQKPNPSRETVALILFALEDSRGQSTRITRRDRSHALHMN